MLNIPADLISIKTENGSVVYRSRSSCGLYRASDELVAVINALRDSKTSTIDEISHRTGIAQQVVSDLIEELRPITENRAHEEQQTNGPQWPQSVAHIRLFLTTQCNMNCSFCYVPELWGAQDSSTMEFDTAAKSIEWWKSSHRESDVMTIRFFGGEPTIAWNLLIQIAEYAKKIHDPENVKLILNTNGTLLDQERIVQLSNLDFKIVFSLDDVPRQSVRFSQKHDLLRVEQNLKLLIKEGCDLTVSCVADLDSDTESFIKYLAGLGVSNVGINPNRFSTKVPSSDEVALITDVIYSAWRIGNDLGINVGGEWRWLLERLESKRLNWQHCFGLGGEISVLPDGSVYPCCGVNIRLGSVFEPRSLSESSVMLPIQERLDYVQTNCLDCALFNVCRGGCAAEALWQNGNMASVWGCELRKSLFYRFLNELVC